MSRRDSQLAVGGKLLRDAGLSRWAYALPGQLEALA